MVDFTMEQLVNANAHVQQDMKVTIARYQKCVQQDQIIQFAKMVVFHQVQQETANVIVPKGTQEYTAKLPISVRLVLRAGIACMVEYLMERLAFVDVHALLFLLVQRAEFLVLAVQVKMGSHVDMVTQRGKAF